MNPGRPQRERNNRVQRRAIPWVLVSGRRLLTLVIVLAAIGVPAGILEVACVGRSCDSGPQPATRVPFCPLPAELRTLLVNGYREGRSPDVLGVADGTPVFTQAEGTSAHEPWPSTSGVDTRVPIAFAGAGIEPGSAIPDGTTLDAIAPTVASALGFDRPFPDVRSGTAIDGTGGAAPSLVLLVAWKGVGTADLEASRKDWPFLASFARDGAETLEGSTGSLPLDPTATLTTIGTGGLPSQHGITGSFVRNDGGDVVPAFGDHAPVPVITTLADDLDSPGNETVPSPYDQEPVISLVATADSDQGLIGGDWYPGHDRDTVDIASGDDAVRSARGILDATPDDGIPDILAVVLDGSVRSMDRRTKQIVDAAERSTRDGTLVAVAGTGTTELHMVARSDAALRNAIEDAVPGGNEAISAMVPGGVFLDQSVLTEAAVTGQVAVDAMLDVTTPEGREMMADAFQGFAVSFARYC
jgi:hypothetical protein